jgi:hypothetical protein
MDCLLTGSAFLLYREDANILLCIPAASIFIDAGINAGGILVHCFGGRSRSAALIAAYIMSTRRISFDETLRLIRSVRPIVSINRGFETQLKAYYDANFDIYAAQQILLRKRVKLLKARRRVVDLSDEGSAMVIASARSPEIDLTSSGHKRSWGDVVLPTSMECEDDVAAGEPKQIGGAMDTQDDGDDEKPVMGDENNTKKRNKTSKLTIASQSPRFLLSQPGSSMFRLFPSLLGLGQAYGCHSCRAVLFHMANVIKPGFHLAVDATNNCDENDLDIIVNDIGDDGDIDAAETAELQGLSLPAVSLPAVPMTTRKPKPFDFGTKSSIDPLPSIRNSGVAVEVQEVYSYPAITPKHRGGKAFGFEDDTQPAVPTGMIESPATSVVSTMVSPVQQGPLSALSINPNVDISGTQFPSSTSPTSSSHSSAAAGVHSTHRAGRLVACNVSETAAKVNGGATDGHFNFSAENVTLLTAANLVTDRNSLRECDITKFVQMVAHDENATKHCMGNEETLYVEYMDWMGQLMFEKESEGGLLCCQTCCAPLGGWTWQVNSRLVNY